MIKDTDEHPKGRDAQGKVQKGWSFHATSRCASLQHRHVLSNQHSQNKYFGDFNGGILMWA